MKTYKILYKMHFKRRNTKERKKDRKESCVVLEGKNGGRGRERRKMK